MVRFAGAARSHVGLVRGNNEDSGFAGPTLMLVADGVGGNAGGEIASATTTLAVASTALSSRSSLADALTEGIRSSQDRLAHGLRSDPGLAGMATTLSAILTDGTDVVLAHLGDSRAYVVRDGELIQVTEDHTWVQEMQDSGQLTAEVAARHPWRSMVLRAVDGSSHADPDLRQLRLRAGDRVLLASDGLTDLVPASEIEALILQHPDTEAVDALVAAALVAGGRDNVTVIVATVVDGPPVVGDGEWVGAVRDRRHVLDPAQSLARSPAQASRRTAS